MKLIVDSGSTKTDWCFANSPDDSTVIKTEGINPSIQSREHIASVVCCQLLPELTKHSIDVLQLTQIAYYGAGCTPDFADIVSTILRSYFGSSVMLSVQSDLLAAAHALCGHKPGIACILGTGSNSCFFDGTDIQLHTPALGYILGDEGGGAVMGRTFLNGILKGWLPDELRDEFLDEYRLTLTDIINKVYHSDAPTRFLASISKFILSHIDNDEVENLVVRNFDDFIVRNLINYSEAEPIINAVGSVAYFYKTQLERAALNRGFKIGTVLRSPMDGLLSYHFMI